MGCVGISMGGYRAVPRGPGRPHAGGVRDGFMSTVRPMMRRHVDTHSWVHFVPGLTGISTCRTSSACTRRSRCWCSSAPDGLFPLAGHEGGREEVADIYARAGSDDRFTWRFYDVPHRFNGRCRTTHLTGWTSSSAPPGEWAPVSQRAATVWVYSTPVTSSRQVIVPAAMVTTSTGGMRPWCRGRTCRGYGSRWTGSAPSRWRA